MSEQSGHGPWGDPSQWNVPPPGAGQRLPDRPQPIQTAVNLMYVGAALVVVGILVFFAQLDDLREELRADRSFLTEEDVDTAMNGAVGGAVISGLLFVGLWIWMAIKNGQGRSWARVTATVLGGLNIGLTALGLLLGSAIGTIDADGTILIDLVTTALAVMILVLLWQPESTRYYEQMSLWDPFGRR